MNATVLVKKELRNLSEGEIFEASALYNKKFIDIKESNFYQILGRSAKEGTLENIAKGIYRVPKITKYGRVEPTENEIISLFINKPEDGCEIGYKMYNKYKLTTQISKIRTFYCNTIKENQKSINNIYFCHKNLEFKSEYIKMIEMLEILSNFNEIQDLDYSNFLNYCNSFINYYNDEIFHNVISQMNYKKVTYAFLKDILDEYNKSNKIYKYLSSLSKYDIPDWRNTL